MKKFSNKSGISLIETLISISVFVILATVSAQSIALSLRGARRSDAISEVRDNLSFAVQSIEQKVRNAKLITSTCPVVNANTLTVQYDDESTETFSCVSEGVNGVVRADSQNLTSSTEISITDCSFSCSLSSLSDLPPEISMSFTAQKKNAPPAESIPITIDSTLRLRVY